MPWESRSCSASQHIPRILRNPKAPYRILKSPPTVSVLTQTVPVYNFPSYCLKIRFNIIPFLHLGDLFPWGFLTSRACLCFQCSCPLVHLYSTFQIHPFFVPCVVPKYSSSLKLRISLCTILIFYGEVLLAPRQTPSSRTTHCRLSATTYSIYLQLPSISAGYFLYQQPEEAPCRVTRDPFNMELSWRFIIYLDITCILNKI